MNPDEQAELKALSTLSDDTLWTIAREQMPNSKQERLSFLLNLNSNGTISDIELTELESLVDSSERLTLRKSEAMKLLTLRGYKITLENIR